MKKIKMLLSSVISVISIGAIIGIVYGSYAQANPNELELLNTAVKNDNFQAYQRARNNNTIIEVGGFATGAIINNQLYTWGSNATGQCGTGDRSPVVTPTIVSAFVGKNVTEISFGHDYAGAIVDNEVYMWGGGNTYGELGLGHTSPVYTPTKVSGLPAGTKTSIATNEGNGEHHSGVIVDGRIWMWGSNSKRQLGSSGQMWIRPVQSQGEPEIDLNSAVALSLGSSHSVAVMRMNSSSGFTVCTWGNNEWFQTGHATSKLTFDKITPLFSGKSIYISAGEHTTIASINGTLSTWGLNVYGNGVLGLLGSGNTSQDMLPAHSYSLINNVSQVKMTATNGYAISNGSLYGWGLNTSGQLGISDFNNRATPTLIQSGGYSQIAANGIYGYSDDRSLLRYAIKNGKIYQWCYNSTPTPTVFNIYASATIYLDSTTDPNNYRSEVVYNMTAQKIKDVVEKSSDKMVLPAINTYDFTNPTNIGSTPYNGKNIGSMTRRIESNNFPILTDVTIRGFLPVNATNEYIFTDQIISLNDEVFANQGINQIVDAANADATGKNSDLAKQIIKNYEPVISPDIYTVDFPKNMKIAKFSDFSYAKDQLDNKKWKIKFSIFVDSYYKRSGQDIILSSADDVPEKFNNQFTVIDLPIVVSRESCVDNNNKINIKNTQIGTITTPSKFFMALTNNELGGTVLNRDLLAEYIDIRFIPTGVPIQITPISNYDTLVNNDELSQKISFRLTTNETFEDYGKWIDFAGRGNKQYSENVNFTIALRNSSIDSNNNVQISKISTGDFLDLIAPNNQLDLTKAHEYLTFIDFPENTTYKFLENTVINKNEEGKLNFTIDANQHYNTGSFNPILENIDKNVIMQGFYPAYDISKYPVGILPDASKKLNDAERFYNSVAKDGQVFDRDKLNQYLDMRGIPYDAKLTLSKANTENDSIKFVLHADRFYEDNGHTIINDEGYSQEFTIAIRQLDTWLIISLVAVGIFAVWFIYALIICKHNKRSFEYDRSN